VECDEHRGRQRRPALAPSDRRRFAAAGALIALVAAAGLAAAGLVRESLRLVVVLILVVAPVTAAWPALVHRGWRRAAAVAGSDLHPIKAPAGASITAFPGRPVSPLSHGLGFSGWTLDPVRDQLGGSDLPLRTTATCVDAPRFSGGQGVAGSNPVVPTARWAVSFRRGIRPSAFLPAETHAGIDLARRGRITLVIIFLPVVKTL
jgi:hypothetical protein